MNNENKPTPAFDPLDMNNYRIEKLPKMKKSGFERVLQRIGAPLAILAFILLYWVVDLPFVNRIDTNKETTTLTSSAVKRYDQLAEVAMQEITAGQTEQTVTPQIEEQVEDAAHNKFIRINYAMLAIFVAAIILWITEAIPNYLTSLMVILGIVLTNITTDKTAYAQLGHPVMWLNILSFILASMLVKTQVAKRFALWFVLKFGRNAGGIMLSFIIINLVLSAFISATTAKAAILLPIFMVVAAIYGATSPALSNPERTSFTNCSVLTSSEAASVSACSVEKSMTLPILSERVSFSFCSSLSTASAKKRASRLYTQQSTTVLTLSTCRPTTAT